MRLSADPTDPGYNPAAMHAKVWLDDVELKLCRTADEDLGIAWCFKEGPDGRLLTVGDEPVLEERHGKVRIELDLRFELLQGTA